MENIEIKEIMDIRYSDVCDYLKSQTNSKSDHFFYDSKFSVRESEVFNSNTSKISINKKGIKINKNEVIKKLCEIVLEMEDVFMKFIKKSKSDYKKKYFYRNINELPKGDFFTTQYIGFYSGIPYQILGLFKKDNTLELKVSVFFNDSKNGL